MVVSRDAGGSVIVTSKALGIKVRSEWGADEWMGENLNRWIHY